MFSANNPQPSRSHVTPRGEPVDFVARREKNKAHPCRAVRYQVYMSNQTGRQLISGLFSSTPAHASPGIAARGTGPCASLVLKSLRRVLKGTDEHDAVKPRDHVMWTATTVKTCFRILSPHRAWRSERGTLALCVQRSVAPSNCKILLRKIATAQGRRGIFASLVSIIFGLISEGKGKREQRVAVLHVAEKSPWLIR